MKSSSSTSSSRRRRRSSPSSASPGRPRPGRVVEHAEGLQRGGQVPGGGPPIAAEIEQAEAQRLGAPGERVGPGADRLGRDRPPAQALHAIGERQEIRPVLDQLGGRGELGGRRTKLAARQRLIGLTGPLAGLGLAANAGGLRPVLGDVGQGQGQDDGGRQGQPPPMSAEPAERPAGQRLAGVTQGASSATACKSTASSAAAA
jgi:hypothetical protein